MRALSATGMVSVNHTLTVPVPADIPPGPQSLVLVFADASAVPRLSHVPRFTPHPVGPAGPAGLNSTYRREEIYGDDGR